VKSVFVALEMGDKIITVDETARLFGVPESNVLIHIWPNSIRGGRAKPKFKTFHTITDLYLWTCKFWYGLFWYKLTYIRVTGCDDLSLMFRLKYSERIRFAIYSDLASIIKPDQIDALEGARIVSTSLFNDSDTNNNDGGRIQGIKPFIPLLETSYKILFLTNNPFV